jgi:hypothetical protein
MTDCLAHYLNDHLAGARFALELLERLQTAYSTEPLGELAEKLLADIGQDRDMLQKLADEVGTGGSTWKDATSWLAEKASRLKLQLKSDSDLGTFEAVETLALGVLGKIKLWQALSAIAASDGRWGQLDFDRLIARAQQQHDALEECRVQMAKAVLGGSGGRNGPKE